MTDYERAQAHNQIEHDAAERAAEKIARFMMRESVRWRDECARLKRELQERQISHSTFASLHERFDSKVVVLETTVAKIRSGEWKL